MLLKHGMKVIDIGAAPGGWSQIIAEKVNSLPGKESVVAVDLLMIDPVINFLLIYQIDGVKFVQGNIENEDVKEKISEMLDF